MAQTVILRTDVQRILACSLIERAPEEITETMSAVQKGGYDHFMLKEVHEALRRGQAGSHPAGHIPGQLTSFENLFRPAEAGRLSEDGDILARLKRIEARLATAKPPAVELDGTLADLSAVVETAVRRVLDDASATIRFSAPATDN